MNYILAAFTTLLIGVLILMTGILITREPRQSISNALKEGLAWGTGFLVSFGIDFLLFANI